MKNFEKAAELIAQARQLIGERVISDSLNEVHIKDPSPEFIAEHRDIISERDRYTGGYMGDFPYEYFFILEGTHFYWITKTRLETFND